MLQVCMVWGKPPANCHQTWRVCRTVSKGESQEVCFSYNCALKKLNYSASPSILTLCIITAQ